MASELRVQLRLASIETSHLDRNFPSVRRSGAAAQRGLAVEGGSRTCSAVVEGSEVFPSAVVVHAYRARGKQLWHNTECRLEYVSW